MENFESSFLKDKYWDKEEFRTAADVSARQREKREGQKTPDTPPERIEAYLDRLDHIVNPPPLKDHSNFNRKERNLAMFTRTLYQRYIVKPENISDDYIKNILLGNEAESLGYEREDLKNEEIRKTVLASLENQIKSPLASYSVPEETRKRLENMIITDQKSRMKQWLEYLTGEEARHAPRALRYWAFAEMLKQGDYDPVRKEYNKRTDATTAVFPELDQQALALVFDEVERRRTGKASALSVNDESRQAEFANLLKSENFGKLYAFMQEHVRSLKLPTERLVITKGEWKVFPQGSSPKELTAPLQGFQTKWCIAGEGHAASYLQTSDMLIYFSEDAEGKNTIPRACIVDNKEHGITEVRGILFNEEAKQHLDDYITPVVADKLKEIKGGEKWAGRMEGMKKLAELHFKHLQNQPLTKDDLVFLYELDTPIEGFGYEKHPRIQEILSHRNQTQDLPILFDCAPSQIAHGPDEITPDTVAYIGPWNPEVYKKLPPTVLHAYERFPDRKIFRKTIEGIPRIKTAADAERALKEKEFFISDYGKDMLAKTEFTGSKETYDLVRFSVASLGFPDGATTDEIYEKALTLGLELVPAEAGVYLRLSYPDQPQEEYLWMAMHQITDRDRYPSVWGVSAHGGKRWLDACLAHPADRWYGDHEFVFRSRKILTA